MKVVRDRPEARWLPARHHFALTRLMAYCRLRFARPEILTVDHLALSIDPDQSATEMYVVCIWILFTTSCFVAAALPLSPGAAAIASIPIAIIGFQALISIGGIGMLLLRMESGPRPNSEFIMTLMVMASSYFAVSPSPVRYVAWFFFAVCVANAVAYAILALLRNSVRELESQCEM